MNFGRAQVSQVADRSRRPVAVAIFVKTPGISPVKTRLARGIGRAAAERCHWLAASATREVAKAAAIGPVYWAVAEPPAMIAGHWPGRLIGQTAADIDSTHRCAGSKHGRVFRVSRARRSGVPRGQQEALGARMARVLDRLVACHGRAIVIGADTPQLEVRALRSAARLLDCRQARMVLGPAYDGGFWLVGANARLDPKPWSRVRYGRADTRRLFRRHLRPQLPIRSVGRLTDLDTQADLARLAGALAALEAPSAAQRELAVLLSRLRDDLVANGRSAAESAAESTRDSGPQMGLELEPGPTMHRGLSSEAERMRIRAPAVCGNPGREDGHDA